MDGYVNYRALVVLLGLFAVNFGARASNTALEGGAMLECSGLPCVEVTIGSGRKARMLIDTGNVRSMLDKESARKLGLELKPFVGGDGKIHAEYSVSTLKNAKIGTAELGDLPVMVANLAPDIAGGTMPAADGSLSYTAFGQRLLRLDYRHHRVELSAALTHPVPCPADCGTLTMPTFGQDGPPIVVTTGFSVNGKPVLVQIDTLFSGTMLIYPSSVEKLGLADDARSKTLRKFPFTDGGVQMIQSRAANERFDGMELAHDCPLYFATPEVHAPDGMFDGTVGHELFMGHVLNFDFYAHHFWIG